MAQSATLTCKKRDKVGSRDARSLRRQGRTVANLQSPDGKPHIDFHFSRDEFLATRRQHVHLYDLDIEGELETAVVRELQWDALGDEIFHVEFKRVQRGVETESEVELSFYGQVKEGVLTHNVTHVTILSIPSLIPDSIEVNVEGMLVGTHIKAGDLVLPEGVSLVLDPDLEIAVVGALRGVAEPEPEPAPEVEAEAEAEAPAPDAPAPEPPSEES